MSVSVMVGLVGLWNWDIRLSDLFGSSCSAAWVAVGVVVAKSLAAGGLHHQHLLLSVAPPCLFIHTA